MKIISFLSALLFLPGFITFSQPPINKVQYAFTVDKGIKLETDIYFKDTTAAYPVIIMRTPYPRKQYASIANFFYSRGFIMVVQSVRGTGGPGGSMMPFVNETDDGLAMNDLAAKAGFNSSILAYADSTIVKLDDGRLPIIGKEAFAASFDKDRDIKTISWSPVNAEVARSGELGYSWGNWKFIAKDTVYYGNYFTVWKKQSDGNWKVVLDGGNNTPKPNN